MHERAGDIFKQQDADGICFTSNGVVKKNGELVMGAGIAKAFKERWANLPKWYGGHVKAHGNCVRGFHIPMDGTMSHHVWVFSYPTKHDWREMSNLDLIIQSAHQLVELVNIQGLKHVYLTRPGCGHGGLSWDTVRPLIGPILNDRFTVLVPEG